MAKKGAYKPREGSIDPQAGPKGGKTSSREAMTEADLASLLSRLVEESEQVRDEVSTSSTGELSGQKASRDRAQEYYDGKMTDTPASPNRSKVVSRDVRAVIKKLMPAMVRTILGSDTVVQYQPTSEAKEDDATQATLYINGVVLEESGGYDAIYDVIHDAALQRTGWLKWWHEEKVDVSETQYTGLDEEAFNMLVAPEEVTVLEHTPRQEQVAQMVQDPQTGTFVEQMVPTQVHDVRVRIYRKKRRIRVGAIPGENIIVHPDALDEDTAQLIGTYEKITRSDLVAMGIDRDRVYDLPIADEHDRQTAEDVRRRYDEDGKVYSPAMEEIDYYDLYARVDYDDDGIAELRRICMAGGLTEENIISNEVWDEAPLAAVKIERRPHQLEGHSIMDDGGDMQQVKTVLLRSVFDNIYAMNNLTPVYQEGVILNPKAFYEKKFGEPVRVRQGTDARAAASYLEVPFFAKDAFGMLGYIDEMIIDRTGISDASAGLPPDALQNVTAKASSLLEQSNIGQTEMMVKTVAKGGLKRMFKGLLKLAVQHQDKPRTVKLNDKWVTFDPRKWDGEMDCEVNTGLGAGTRERDQMMVTMLMGVQEKLLASLGAVDNPFVSEENVWNSLEKLVQATGGKNVNAFFTKPDPEKLKQRAADRKANKPPTPAEMLKMEYELKGQLEVQKEKVKADADVAKTQATMQKEQAKEVAQMQADVQVKLAELKKEQAIREQEIAWEREKLASEQAHDLKMQELKNKHDDMIERQRREQAETEGYMDELFNEDEGATKQ